MSFSVGNILMVSARLIGLDVYDRLSGVRARIAAACTRVGRAEEEVRLIGVTKYVGVDETRALWDAGLSEFGENRIEQSVEKIEHVPNAVWHYIGALQSRKIQQIVQRFDVIHSLDRLSIASAIDRAAESRDLMIPCLVQVNVSGESSKGGLAPVDVAPFLRQVAGLKGIAIVGLMTMAPAVTDPEEVRPVFRGLSQLRSQLEQEAIDGVWLHQLSMGMSGDFEVAIEEGATMVRLGSVLVKPTS